MVVNKDLFGARDPRCDLGNIKNGLAYQLYTWLDKTMNYKSIIIDGAKKPYCYF